MKQFIVYLLFLSVSNAVWGQTKTLQLPEKVERIFTKKESLLRKATKQIIRGTYSYVQREDLKGAKIIPIPMFYIKRSNQVDYADLDEVLKLLRYNAKNKFSYILAFKVDNLVGYFSSNGIEDGGTMTITENKSAVSTAQEQVKLFDFSKYEKVFYIREILHTYWFVQDGKLMVYSYLYPGFYDAYVFWNKYYSHQRVKAAVDNIPYIPTDRSN